VIIVNSTAPEPLYGSERKLTQIFHSDVPLTDEVSKVIGRTVEVTESQTSFSKNTFPAEA